jgi:hypothetical protein
MDRAAVAAFSILCKPARLLTGIVSHNRDGRVRRRMRFGWRQVVDADVRIYVQEVRAVHAAATDGGMRAAVRLPGMQCACPPCPPDRAKLPQHVGRNASGRCKVRAHYRRIARPGKTARSRMQLLRRPGYQDGETCQGEGVSASLTDLTGAPTRRRNPRPPLRSLLDITFPACYERRPRRPLAPSGCGGRDTCGRPRNSNP